MTLPIIMKKRQLSNEQDCEPKNESGNIVIYILGAIALVGLLIVMVRGSVTPGSAIDAETVMLRASQIQQYGTELERAVTFILRNGHSETDIRFAHPNTSSAYGVITDTPSRQIFDRQGGGAEYRAAPDGVNDGTAWQFYARTHIKDMGTDTAASMRSELVAVLPNVTEAFCNKINDLKGQDLTLTDNHDPTANGCIHAGTGNEFAGTFLDGATANTLDDTFFTHLPPTQACILCQSDGALHFYHVLLAR